MSEPPREPLLRDLSQLASGDTDVRVSRRDFLPTPAHRRALGLDVVVVRGARGAGKTAFFKLASSIRDVADLRSFFEDSRLPDARWVDAFSLGNLAHPEVSVLEGYAPGASNIALRAFWMTHLLRRLLDDGAVKVSVPEALVPVLSAPAADLPTWLPVAEKQLGLVSATLDAAERSLASDGRYVFAAYDSLDLLGQFDHEVRRRYVSTLLAMWLLLSTRYQHLRGKVFLREDLFDPVELGFVDAAKLRTRSESLDWNGEALYRLVVRHLANASEDSRALLREVPGLTLSDRGEDGWMPGPMSDAVQRAFVLKLAPRAVGKGVLKSDAHTWILSRLQDSQGRITPRALLWFLSFAADAAQQSRRTRGPLLVADDLLGAIRCTSRERANEIQEEYSIARRIESLRGMSLPMSRAETLERLQKPAQGETGTRLARGELALDELIRVGVLREMPDGRFDVPDIFRYHFGIGPDYVAAWKDFVEKDDLVARYGLWPSVKSDLDDGRLEQARQKIETSLALAKSSGDLQEEGRARLTLGRILFAEEDTDSARREFERALDALARSRELVGEVAARVWLGIAAFKERDFDQARTLFEQARRASSSHREWYTMEFAAQLWLGRLQHALKRYDEAIEIFLTCITNAQSSLDALEEAWPFRELGEVASNQGRTIQAVSLVTLAEIRNPKPHTKLAWELAQQAGLTRAQHDALREELRTAYAKDRGWSVIREAFPDLPEKDPAGKA